jgi:hypothetical protein
MYLHCIIPCDINYNYQKSHHYKKLELPIPRGRGVLIDDLLSILDSRINDGHTISSGYGKL